MPQYEDGLSIWVKYTSFEDRLVWMTRAMVRFCSLSEVFYRFRRDFITDYRMNRIYIYCNDI